MLKHKTFVLLILFFGVLIFGIGMNRVQGQPAKGDLQDVNSNGQITVLLANEYYNLILVTDFENGTLTTFRIHLKSLRMPREDDLAYDYKRETCNSSGCNYKAGEIIKLKVEKYR